MPNVSIGGDASGAIAAVGAAQGAIDSLSGKTVAVEVEVRQSGGGSGGLGGLADDLDKVAKAGQRANRATKGFADNMERAGKTGGGLGGGFERAGAGAERAGRAAKSMGEEMERAGGHTAALAGHAERVSSSMRAISSGASSSMKAIASGAAGATGGMRALEAGTNRAGQSFGSLNSVPTAFRTIGASASVAGRSIGASASIASQGMKQIESSAGRAEVAVRKAASAGRSGGGGSSMWSGSGPLDLRQQADGSFGVGGPIAAIGAGGGSAGKPKSAPKAGEGGAKPFSWAGVDGSSMGNTGGFSARPEGTQSRAHQKEQERAAAGPQAERPFSSGGAAEQLAARKAASGVDEVGKASEKATGSAMSLGKALTAGGSPHHIERMIRPLQEAGFQLAMVGGMMAGAAKSADGLMNATTGMGMNFKGMSAGIEQAEQSAARSHNLGLNGMDQELRQTARAMTNELAPAMKAGVQATKSFEEAKMGAQGSMGSELAGFANQMTKSSPALQGIMSSLGKSALNLGTDVVAGLAQTGPAFSSMADSIARNGPEIAQFSKETGEVAAGLLGTAARATGFAEDKGNDINSGLDKALGAKRDSSGNVSSVGTGGHILAGLLGTGSSLISSGIGGDSGAKAVKPGQFDPNKPFSGTAINADGSETTGTGDSGAGTSGATPFSGSPRSFSDMAKAGGGKLAPPGPRQRSSDAAWADGMTGAQILTAERGAIGLGPVGAPEYSGHGTPPAGLGQPRAGAAPPVSQRGGGAPPGTFSSLPGDLAHQPNASSGNPQPPRVGGAGSSAGGRAIPSGIAGGLGMGGGALGSLMTGGMQSAIGSSGGDTGQAMVKHVQKAVQTASPAASSGGASVGSAAGSGIAQGITTSQTVTDTAMIKHVKKIIDTASGPSGIDAHSPSKKFDDMGRLIPQGLAQGMNRDGDYVFGAAQSMVGNAQSFGANSPDYGGAAGRALTVTAPKAQDPNQQAQDPNQAPLSPMQSTSSLSMAPPVNQFGAAGMANIQRHNDNAAKLAQGRMDNHAIAEANLGNTNPATGQKWQDPRNQNPFAGEQAQASQRAQGVKAVVNPFSQIGQKPDQAGQPGQSGAGGMGSGPGSAYHASGAKLTGPWAGLAADMHSGMVKAGTNSVAGLTQGIKVGLPKASGAGSDVAGAAQAGYKKADKQNSPSAVWAGMGGNSVAGVPIGFAAGVPAAVSAISGATQTMSDAIAGPLNNQGLMLGYNYAENIVTGAQTVLKTANFQASGTPAIANLQAQAALGAASLLGPGAGASIYKTPSVAMDTGGIQAQIATLAAAIQSRPVQVTVNLDGQYVDQKVASGTEGLVSVLMDAITGSNG